MVLIGFKLEVPSQFTGDRKASPLLKVVKRTMQNALKFKNKIVTFAPSKSLEVLPKRFMSNRLLFVVFVVSMFSYYFVTKL